MARKLLTCKEVAKLIHVNESTVRNWESEGRMPRGKRNGPRCVRWDLAELDLWIEWDMPHRLEFERLFRLRRHTA